MMNAPTWSAPRRRGLVATALAALVAAVPALGGEAPGPVPLVRDAVPAAAGAGRAAVAPTGLGDWRLVAALGVAFAVVVGARMTAGRRVPPLPPDVFEMLGSASLGGQHAVRIVRFGPKTLLVGVSAAGMTTLAEITDAPSTACIVAACRGGGAPAREAARAPARGPAAKGVA